NAVRSSHFTSALLAFASLMLPAVLKLRPSRSPQILESVTCEGSTAQLKCDAGQVISIIKANYGRLDGRKCARGRPKSQLNNVKCSNPANKVSNQCDGKQTCSIRATSNSVFGDPCGGTYKYLEVDYTCERDVTCEGSVAQFQCEPGQVISILKANYGRLDENTCAAGRPKAQTRRSPTPLCFHSCQGKSSCSVGASNSVFGDPCGGTYKYLEPPTVGTEHADGSVCSDTHRTAQLRPTKEPRRPLKCWNAA
uniref:SUEL-type lectin domain-containing protein n=1 Tax=Salarias fasciatus TaxID=181472 RepID=A0A672HAA4_SALFA